MQRKISHPHPQVILFTYFPMIQDIPCPDSEVSYHMHFAQQMEWKVNLPDPYPLNPIYLGRKENKIIKQLLMNEN